MKNMDKKEALFKAAKSIALKKYKSSGINSQLLQKATERDFPPLDARTLLLKCIQFLLLLFFEKIFFG